MHCLPHKCASAATNMATDQLMLTNYPQPRIPRFRHYSWELPAYTFGFAQRWGQELEALLRGGHEVIRRETGGGLVDHRSDWTYGLIIPPTHKLAREAPTEIYHGVHVCLVDAIQRQNIKASLQTKPPPPKRNHILNACFKRAELSDVISESGQKIAGAAQRRNRDGFLIQGYLERSHLPGFDWKRFEQDFAENLGKWLASSMKQTEWPDWDAQTLQALEKRFASDAWNKKRKR